MGRIIPAFTQFFTDDGVPLANGWLRFLISGSNNTDKNTYADTIYQIPNTNPLQLDAAGRCPDIFGVGDYRVVSYINDPVSGTPGTQVQMFDPVTAQGTTTTGGGSGTAFDSWDSDVTYGINSIVERDLRTFRSLIDPNNNLDPLLETYAWEQVDFIRYYNETVTYSNAVFVYYNGGLYQSTQNLNQNNTPSISPLFWRPIASGYYGFVNSLLNYSITTSDRDKIIVLTAAAVADRTFTLPSMSSATDGFKVAVYNISDYNLVIDTSGSDGIWLSSTDSIIVTKGAMVEFIYNYATTNWIIIGNVGPALGGQNIGTVDNPITTINVMDIELSGDLSLPDNSNIFLGADNDLTIYFDGSSAIFGTIGSVPIDFQINSTSVFTINQTSIEVKQDLTFTGAINPQIIFDSGVGTDTSLYIDSSGFVIDSNGALSFNSNFGASSALNFQVAGILRWTIDSSGYFVPSLSNAYRIGTPTNRIGRIYQGTSQPYYIGNSQEMIIQFDGVYGSIQCAGGINLKTTTAADFRFYTNSSLRWSITSAGDLIPQAASIDIGASSDRVDTIYAVNDLDFVSDLKLKTDVVNSELGLDFIDKIRPISYKLIPGKCDRRHYGVASQEVRSVLESMGYSYDDFAGVKYDKIHDSWSFSYSELIAPIIKAIQELKEIVDDQAQKFGNISIQQPNNR